MKKLKEIYLRITGNPLLGYIPLYIFTITDYITTTEIALISSFLACSLTFVLVVVLGGRGNVHAALFCAVSLISISILTILFLIPGFEEIKEQYHDYSQLFSEIVIASVLLLIVSLKGRIQRYFITTIRSNISATFLSSIDEYIYITRITLYILLAHMVTVAVFIPVENQTITMPLLWGFVPFLVFGFIIFEYVRLYYLRKQLNTEEWLAVVNNKGNVIGRIAKSESQKAGNKYLHPVIRIAIINRGQLFLTSRTDVIMEPEKIDHPFEKYVQYEHSLDHAASALLRIKNCHKMKPDFSVKYFFENDITKRLVFLYTIEISEKDEVLFSRKHFDDGKFWTQKQIEENIGLGLFSECFEKEYEYLKNTILLVSSYVAEVPLLKN